MNARTGESPDYLIDDNLKHVPLPEKYALVDDLLPSYSLDKKWFKFEWANAT